MPCHRWTYEDLANKIARAYNSVEEPEPPTPLLELRIAMRSHTNDETQGEEEDEADQPMEQQQQQNQQDKEEGGSKAEERGAPARRKKNSLITHKRKSRQGSQQ